MPKRIWHGGCTFKLHISISITSCACADRIYGLHQRRHSRRESDRSQSSRFSSRPFALSEILNSFSHEICSARFRNWRRMLRSKTSSGPWLLLYFIFKWIINYSSVLSCTSYTNITSFHMKADGRLVGQRTVQMILVWTERSACHHRMQDLRVNVREKQLTGMVDAVSSKVQIIFQLDGTLWYGWNLSVISPL